MNVYLKRLREAKGYSQRKLASVLGCSPGLIARLETEEDFSPSDDLSQRLAQELGGDPDVVMLAAGRVSQRLRGILQTHPEAFAQVIRALEDQPEHALLRISREVKDGKW